MRQVDHFLAAGTEHAGGGRTHKIWNPSTGEVQAEVALGDAALLQVKVILSVGNVVVCLSGHSTVVQPKLVAHADRNACPNSAVIPLPRTAR